MNLVLFLAIAFAPVVLSSNALLVQVAGAVAVFVVNLLVFPRGSLSLRSSNVR